MMHSLILEIAILFVVFASCGVFGFEAVPPRNRTRKPVSFQSPLHSSATGLIDELDNAPAIARRVFQEDRRPVILFDGVCNMCNGAVNLALDWDPKGKLRFSALQSNVGRALLEANGRRADDISSIVLVTKDGAYIKSDAVLKIAEELTPLPFLPLQPVASLGRLAVPKILRDIIYDGVADNGVLTQEVAPTGSATNGGGGILSSLFCAKSLM